MTSAVEHCKILLSAIIPDRRDLLDKALRHLNPEHFPEKEMSVLFYLLDKYANATNSVLKRNVLSDMLKGKDSGTIAFYEELYDSLALAKVDDSDFKWSMEQIRELAAERETDDALIRAREILKVGREEGGKKQQGFRDSINFATSKFAEVEHQLLMQESPEGNMRKQGDEMLADYADEERKKAQGKGDGILFGIPELDYKIGGLHDGYLVLIAGYSSSGKTGALVQLAWNACVNQGKNVAFMTTETVYKQVRRKILCRHSKLPQFGLPEGLDSRKVRDCLLSDEEKRILQDVVRDFTRNPSYGELYISQMPRNGSTVGAVESRLNRMHRNFHVDLCLVDYFQLFQSDRRRTSDREEQSNIIKAAKQLAVTFDDGRGVPVVSPWQVNRTWREKAGQQGYYTTAALSETAESTNSSDVIISLLEPDDNDERYAELKGQILKNRDGLTSSSIPIKVDYATCTYTTPDQSTGMDDLLGDGDDLGGLL